MKKLILFVLVLFSFFVSAAPAPNFFAVNNSTGECGIFWPGDEFYQNQIPEGWETVDYWIEVDGNGCLAEMCGESYCKSMGYEWLGNITDNKIEPPEEPNKEVPVTEINFPIAFIILYIVMPIVILFLIGSAFYFYFKNKK